MSAWTAIVADWNALLTILEVFKTNIGLLETDMAGRVRSVLLCVMLISGCADIYDAGHSYSQGWRVGEVKAIGTSATAFPITAFDCRRKVAQSSDTVRSYAYVQFDFSPTGKGFYHPSRYGIVPVSDRMGFKEGDEVFLNIRDCSKTIAAIKSP